MYFLKMESFQSFSFLSAPVFESYESNIHYTCWKYDMKLNISLINMFLQFGNPVCPFVRLLTLILTIKPVTGSFFFDDIINSV